jgi:hypothetical protein
MATALLAYLTVHFFAVIVYAFPVKNENRLKAYVFPYIYPYFHQDWSMFVPVPKENYNVYIKYDSKEWSDLLFEINLAHQRNRLAGNEALLFSLANGMRYYAASIKEVSQREEDNSSNVNFLVLRKIITEYIRKKDPGECKNIQVILRIQDMGNHKDHSHYYKLKD